MTHYVYSAFDADRRPLYVGYTGNLRQRMRQHKSASAWVQRAAVIYVERFATRDEALTREAERIRNFRPIHNIQGNPRYCDVADVIAVRAWVEECRAFHGGPDARSAWLAAHPEATARQRKTFALADLRDRRSA